MKEFEINEFDINMTPDEADRETKVDILNDLGGFAIALEAITQLEDTKEGDEPNEV